ncbi:hypothetical protein G3I01_16950 [Gramella sp. MT6]|uniref:hypothetical protein n=1 Tax=Gramella sp. MT6 TaxID=2705471 RepID=UPI001C5EA266|nr:hypothetical protein [Gramella sp. MT6]QYA27109.1 hypothetical protein G3I01_16950 [Gramella sp. MT6]
MKYSRFYIIASIPLLVFMLIAVVYKLHWLLVLSELITYIILLRGFSRRLNFSNLNILSFLGLNMVATLFKFFQSVDAIHSVVMFFQMVSYIFLVREALKYTQRESGNKFMFLFFFLMLSVNSYFVFDHFQELENQIVSLVEVAFYSMYYIVLFVLALVCLIYYLNSYSRKSVFFVTLVMTILIADIMRDMALYYLPDTSVLLLQNFLRFIGIIMAFQFFATHEKKLKLINLV